MKYYCLEIAMPDDMDPSNVTVSYPGEDGTSVTASLSDEAIVNIADDLGFSMSIEELPKDAVAILKYDPYMEYEDMESIHRYVETALGRTTIGFVGDIDLLIENAPEAIDMLEKMIAKIKIQQGTPNTSKIILS